MTEKEKAEGYVRSKCPELMELSFGCKVLLNYGGIAIVTGRRFEGYWKVDWDGMVCTDTFILDKHIKEIIGHPIQLQHWLRVLEKSINGCEAMLGVDGSLYEMRSEKGWDAGQYRHYLGIDFNLTTGQPAAEADYKAFNEIVGAKEIKN